IKLAFHFLPWAAPATILGRRLSPTRPSHARVAGSRSVALLPPGQAAISPRPLAGHGGQALGHQPHGSAPSGPEATKVRHAQPALRTSSVIFLAASARLSAGTLFTPAWARICFPPSTFVPSRRTTTGALIAISLAP